MPSIGRIDIQYRDGRSQSHLLSEEAVTLGSAPDNTICVFDGDLAEYQLRFIRQRDAIYLVNLDADQPTTIDGLSAPVNKPQLLSAVAQIRVGELSIVFNQSSDSPTVALNASLDRTQPAARGFRASLAKGVIHVWPCSSFSTTLSITNLTDDIAQFSVRTGGLSAEWTTPARLIFSVNGGDTLEILFTIAPPRRADIRPGEYPLAISVSRLDSDESAAQLVLLVQLGSFAGLSVALQPQILRPKQPFRVSLLNLGNDKLPLRLLPYDSKSKFDIRLERQEVLLSAGELAVISGVIDLKRKPIFGPPAAIPFALLAQAPEPNRYLVSQPATAIVDPMVGNRALILAALAAVFALVAFVALITRPPQPSIAAFALSDQQVAQGRPVELAWDASDVERFVIELDRAPIAELPGGASSYSLDTSAYSDPIEIALIALNGAATDIESRRLEIYQPVRVTRFEVDKTALLRNIRGSLTVTWRVEGAVALNIALPPGFETTREKITGEDGEIAMQGEPADDFQIVLSAEDKIGGTTTRVIAIAVSEPECAPVRDARLYRGPDTGYAHVNDAVQNVPVLVKGINEDKRWLQVELASGERGWGFLSAFRCRGFDPASLNVISDFPQMPSPTPAPQYTRTSRPAPALRPKATNTSQASPGPESSATARVSTEP